jgi:hypothetical protein
MTPDRIEITSLKCLKRLHQVLVATANNMQNKR